MIIVILEGLLIIGLIINDMLFSYVPLKKIGAYMIEWFHRALHLSAPENTLKAIDDAKEYQDLIESSFPKNEKKEIGIEIDIRYLPKDDMIIVFHDHFTKRLLGVPGVIEHFTYEELKKFNVLDSSEKIPTLEEALKKVDGKLHLLIEPKGALNKKYREKLFSIMEEYEKNQNKKIYYHTINLFSYFVLAKKFKNKVFWVCNISRKRFCFNKSKEYDKLNRVVKMTNYNSDFLKNSDKFIEIPSKEDIGKLLIDSFEGNVTFNSIVNGLSLSEKKSRITDDSWLKKSLLIHRGIFDSSIPENSLENFKKGAEHFKALGLEVTIEIDLIFSKKLGEPIITHPNKGADFLGQERTGAAILSEENSMSFRRFIAVIKKYPPNVNLILDMKDMSFFDRKLQKSILSIIAEENFKGKFSMQSFWPPALLWLEKNHPEILRGQVYNSLKRFKHVNFLRKLIHLALSSFTNPDYCLYDNDPYLWAFLKYQEKICKKPIVIYCVKSEEEYNKLLLYYDKIEDLIIMVEDILNRNKWSEDFILNYKDRGN